MSKIKKVSLLGLAYELGELRDIRSLNELSNNNTVLEALLKLDLKTYSKSMFSASEMAYNSIQSTIEKSSLPKSEIDALLYVSDQSLGLDSRQEVSRVMDKLELTNAYPIGISLSASGNLHTAIRIATSLLRTDEYRNILIATVSKLEDYSSRIVPPNVSVQSDAAASCIVSSTVEGTFDIIKTVQHANASINNIDPLIQSTEYFDSIAEGIQLTVEKLMGNIGKVSKDFSKFIMNNYNSSVAQTICAISGFSQEQTFTENIHRFAHAVASDNIINLCDMLDKDYIQKCDLILLLGTGPSTWGATALLKV